MEGIDEDDGDDELRDDGATRDWALPLSRVRQTCCSHGAEQLRNRAEIGISYMARVGIGLTKRTGEIYLWEPASGRRERGQRWRPRLRRGRSPRKTRHRPPRRPRCSFRRHRRSAGRERCARSGEISPAGFGTTPGPNTNIRWLLKKKNETITKHRQVYSSRTGILAKGFLCCIHRPTQTANRRLY